MPAGEARRFRLTPTWDRRVALGLRPPHNGDLRKRRNRLPKKLKTNFYLKKLNVKPFLAAFLWLTTLAENDCVRTSPGYRVSPG